MAGLRSPSRPFAGIRVSVPRPSVVVPSRGALVVQNAHKKGAGSTKNGRDSNSKSRGVKVFGGQPVTNGGIIVRQLGNKVRIGPCFGRSGAPPRPAGCAAPIGHAAASSAGMSF